MNKDELIGEWHTDDGGGFMLLMGSIVHFKENGSGTYHSWAGTGKSKDGYDIKGKFQWKRTGDKQIVIMEEDYEQVIDYKLEPFEGSYNSSMERLYSNEETAGRSEERIFWNLAQELMRSI